MISTNPHTVFADAQLPYSECASDFESDASNNPSRSRSSSNTGSNKHTGATADVRDFFNMMRGIS
jgi:hypothetical protein